MGDFESGFLFPEEFPYDDFVTSSDVSSPVSSADSDEDDSKVVDLGCSPQSTLCSDRDWATAENHRHFQVSQFQKLKQQQMLMERKGARTVFSSGMAPRRESTGTGVFLPRTSVAPVAEARKKPPSSSTVVLPARVVQALNLNLEEIGARPIFPGGAFILDKEAMKARTRSLQSQQRAINHRVQSSEPTQRETRLPPEWTY